MSKRLERSGWIWVLTDDGDHNGNPELELFPRYNHQLTSKVVVPVVNVSDSFYIAEIIGDVNIGATEEGGHSGINDVTRLGDEIIIEDTGSSVSE
tara:strand:+ start:346 stop:630 length:285 start_codon:yes stop_codon:yes gene_type:complete